MERKDAMKSDSESMEPKTVEITVTGKTIQARKGETIIHALWQAGLGHDIQTGCDGGVCDNADVPCGPADKCCGPGCDSGNDPDCPSCLPKHGLCSSNQDCCSGQCKNNGRCR